MAFDDPIAGNLNEDRTRIVCRNDEEPDVIEKMIQESRQYRLDYWEKQGREEMLAKAKISSEMPAEWRKKFSDATWEYRQCYGEDLRSISGGIRHFCLHLARNGAPLEAAKQRNSSKFAKQIFSMVMRSYIGANIVKITSDSALSNAFLVAKPKPPGDTPSMKNLADLQNPEINDRHLTASFRLIIDLAKIGKAIHPFSSPNITSKEVMATFARGKKFITLDGNSYFSQIALSRGSRYLTAFATASAALQYVLARTPQGAAQSSAAASLILKLILHDLIVEGQSFTYIDNICLSDFDYQALFDLYVTVLKRADHYNLVFKLSDLHRGFSCDDTPFEVLGFEIADGKLRIPRRKLEAFSSNQFPKTKKAILKLVGNLNYYSEFSSGFAQALTHLRQELKYQQGRKFVFTNKMDRLVKILLEMMCQHSGLYLLSKEQFQSSPFILFVDSSQETGFSAVVPPRK